MRKRLRGVLLAALCLGVTANVLADTSKPPPPVWKTLRPFKSTAEFDDYRRHVRDSDVVLIEGVGHWPQLEAPAATLEAVFAFHDRL